MPMSPPPGAVCQRSSSRENRNTWSATKYALALYHRWEWENCWKMAWCGCSDDAALTSSTGLCILDSADLWVVHELEHWTFLNYDESVNLEPLSVFRLLRIGGQTTVVIILITPRTNTIHCQLSDFEVAGKMYLVSSMNDNEDLCPRESAGYERCCGWWKGYPPLSLLSPWSSRAETIFHPHYVFDSRKEGMIELFGTSAGFSEQACRRIMIW